MTTFTGLQAGITPRDLQKSLTFYRDLLGLPYLGALETSGIILHRFSVGDAILKLGEVTEQPTMRNPEGSPVDASGIRWVTVDVDDLDALVARLQNAEATLVSPIVSDEHGTRFAIVADPDGVWVELIQPS